MDRFRFDVVRNRLTDEAIRDLDEALRVAPTSRDVRRILLKAKEETQNRPATSGVGVDQSVLDCSSSSGVGSSLASTSERG